MDGANETRAPGAVAERAAHLGDEHTEARVGYERPRPQPFVNVRLRQRSRALPDQADEQIERLGRYVDLARSAEKLPSLFVEHERVEAEQRLAPVRPLHDSVLRIPWSRGADRRDGADQCARDPAGGRSTIQMSASARAAP